MKSTSYEEKCYRTESWTDQLVLLLLAAREIQKIIIQRGQPQKVYG